MNQNLIIVCKLMIELFIFSCAGWMMEVTLKYFQYHRFINRGYLIGPYCPIYGCGVVAVTVLVEGILHGSGSYADVFLVGLVVCGALEYFVSWFMEATYHARWWDYSTKPMNLNGRIWIGNLILFGLGTVIIIKWINPVLFGIMGLWSERFVVFFAAGIVLLFLSDNIASGILMNIVKEEIDAREEDNTEEISRKVHELLRDRNMLVRRISEAYPELQARPKRLTRQLKEARAELKQATKHVKDELAVVSEKAKEEFTQSLDMRNKKKAELEAMFERMLEGLEEARGESREEKKIRLANARERLIRAKESLREAQEKLTFHRD